MAAHAVTGLRETLKMAQDTSSYLFSQMRAALSLSCWTEDLDLDGWRALNTAVQDKDFDAVEEVAGRLLANATGEWESLGRPATREEWLRAKWGEEN